MWLDSKAVNCPQKWGNFKQRRANQLERWLKEARFPVMKTLEKTDLALWPTLDGVEVRELTQCTWVSERTWL